MHKNIFFDIAVSLTLEQLTASFHHIQTQADVLNLEKTNLRGFPGSSSTTTKPKDENPDENNVFSHSYCKKRGIKMIGYDVQCSELPNSYIILKCTS